MLIDCLKVLLELHKYFVEIDAMNLRITEG